MERSQRRGAWKEITEAVDAVEELISQIENYHCRRNCTGEDQELDDLVQFAETAVRPALDQLSKLDEQNGEENHEATPPKVRRAHK